MCVRSWAVQTVVPSSRPVCTWVDGRNLLLRLLTHFPLPFRSVGRVVRVNRAMHETYVSLFHSASHRSVHRTQPRITQMLRTPSVPCRFTARVRGVIPRLGSIVRNSHAMKRGASAVPGSISSKLASTLMKAAPRSVVRAQSQRQQLGRAVHK